MARLSLIFFQIVLTFESYLEIILINKVAKTSPQQRARANEKLVSEEKASPLED